jgi:hypothetical protein
MNKLDKAIEILQLRLESLNHAVKHNADNGDYDRAATTKTRASEVFNILQELNKLKDTE